jgi:Zn-dependent protease
MSPPPPLPVESSPPLACPHCNAALGPHALACARCGQFVHAGRLSQLSSEALGLEPINPWAAATLWQQCLELVPPDAPQRPAVQHRIDVLSAGLMPAQPVAAPHPGAPVLNYRPRATQEDPLGKALFKTFGSMAISIAVYAFLFQDVWFAAAFVVLMLVHEMGHVIANKYYGLSASPPIFIPFLGAVINLRQRPPNAKAEAIVGIGGPILGTLGSIAAYVYALQTGSHVAYLAAHFGFLLNLFNLLPVPPLDGGRVTAAVSPWIWMLGVAGLAWLFIADWRAGHVNYILILVLFYAFPRIKATLQGRDRFSEYYRISRAASWSIAALYLALGGSLIYLYQTTMPPGRAGW